LQEDKERLFDTADTVRACVRLMAGMLAHTQVNAEACRAAAADPQLLATDLADHLVRRGVPFRQAHHAVGAAVALAERTGRSLDCLTIVELRGLHPGFGSDALEVFDLKTAMNRRTVVGAPSVGAVRRELRRWRRALGPRDSAGRSRAKHRG
jgi:argininosuccinate lyase